MLTHTNVYSTEPGEFDNDTELFNHEYLMTYSETGMAQLPVIVFKPWNAGAEL